MKYVAKSPDEVAAVFGQTFYNEVSQPGRRAELDERTQLAAFLIAAAYTRLVSYPIAAEHTTNQNPDFKVTFEGKVVGIEVSKIANTVLEQMRSHQNKGDSTIAVSQFLINKPVGSFKQNLDDAYLLPSMIHPDPTQAQDEENYWLDRALYVINHKSEISKKANFNRYDDSWLLLGDKLCSSKEELQKRSGFLGERLVCFWRKSLFTRIIIQQNDDPIFRVLSHGKEDWLHDL